MSTNDSEFISRDLVKGARKELIDIAKRHCLSGTGKDVEILGKLRTLKETLDALPVTHSPPKKLTPVKVGTSPAKSPMKPTSSSSYSPTKSPKKPTPVRVSPPKSPMKPTSSSSSPSSSSKVTKKAARKKKCVKRDLIAKPWQKEEIDFAKSVNNATNQQTALNKNRGLALQLAGDQCLPKRKNEELYAAMSFAKQLADIPVSNISSSAALHLAARENKKCLNFYEEGKPLPEGDVCQGCELKDGNVDCEWSLEGNNISGDKFMLVLGDSKPIFGGEEPLKWLNSNKFDNKGKIVKLGENSVTYKNAIDSKREAEATANAAKKQSPGKGKSPANQFTQADVEEAQKSLKETEAMREKDREAEAKAQRKAAKEEEVRRKAAEDAEKAAKKQSPGKGKSPMKPKPPSSLIHTPLSASSSSTSSARVQAADLTDFFAKCIAAKMNT